MTLLNREQERRRVVYCSPYVPAEWIAAHGLVPYILTPKGTGSSGPVEGIAGTCAFMRAFVNESLEVADAAATIVTTACDQMRRSGDLLPPDADTPFFTMHLPTTWQTPGAHAYYRTELRRLSRFFTGLGGSAPSDSRLIAVMERFERGRTALLADSAFNRAPSLTDALNALYGAQSLPKSDHEPNGRIPIALIGGPMTRTDSGVAQLIEQNDGYIALDGTELGERSWPARFDRRELGNNPLGVLADAYFGAIPDVFRRPNSELFAWVKKEIANRDVRGVVALRYVWCDCWHAEIPRLREWLDVPVIDIDLTGVDGIARNETRVGAFMEAIA